MNPDILIVDEVLAVGDMQFQKKCLGKMGEVTSQQGRSVMFVSHNMVAVESICSRCILLESGRIVFDGDTRSAIRRYLAGSTVGVQEAVGVYDLAGVAPEATPGYVGNSVRSARILRRLTVQGAEGIATNSIVMGEGMRLTIDVQDLSVVSQMVSVRIKTEDDLVVAGVHSQLRPLNVLVPNGRPDEVVLEFPSIPLMPGRYWIEVAVSEGQKGKVIVEAVDRAAPLDVVPSNLFGSGWQVQRGARFGLVLVDPRWELRSAGKVIAESEHDVASPALPVTAIGKQRRALRK
ncbi:MAG TPA: Wzt carbohydrate-binding domain-containing protein [Ilumatobacter sp.]|nr:Wzt carbohydrate-binding domain-containing protein [Ilumatobacter sp.]